MPITLEFPRGAADMGEVDRDEIRAILWQPATVTTPPVDRPASLAIIDL
jgi:hypothetical protein